MTGTRPRKAVLLDLHDTLVEMPLETWHDSLARVTGVPRDRIVRALRRGARDRVIGNVRSPEETAEQLRSLLGAREHVIPALIALRRRFFDEARVFPDVPPVLEALRGRGVPLGLVTNCTIETRAMLRRSGLAACFDALALSCELRVLKPDPAIYLHACAVLGVEPAECVFAGDGARHELAGARALGMRTVRIEREGARRPAEPDPCFDVRLPNLEGLPDLVDGGGVFDPSTA